MLASQPHAQIAWTDPRMRGAWAAIIAAALVALVFLPQSFTNNDEYYYAGQAYVLSKGRVTPRAGDPLPVPGEIPAQAFRYPVAWPAVLAPARLVSIRATYVVVLLVHLLGGAIVARMLVRRGARSALAAAYLFHPVFWLYSRTLLSDLPATVALLVAMDAWENRRQGVAAGALGFASASRLANAAFVFGFGLSIITEWRAGSSTSPPRPGRRRVLGVQMLVNHALGGYWLLSPYLAQNALLVTGNMALENVLLYAAGLALLPPFSLIAALVRPRQVDRWAFVALVMVAVYLPMSCTTPRRTSSRRWSGVSVTSCRPTPRC